MNKKIHKKSNKYFRGSYSSLLYLIVNIIYNQNNLFYSAEVRQKNKCLILIILVEENVAFETILRRGEKNINQGLRSPLY